MFADRLRQLRKRNGITQKELAEIINVDRSSIGKYEGNSGVIPSDDVKKKIADYFHVSVDYLLERDEESDSVRQDLNLTPDELKLLTDYRNLNKQGQEYIRQTMYMALPIYKKSDRLSVVED